MRKVMWLTLLLLIGCGGAPPVQPTAAQPTATPSRPTATATMGDMCADVGPPLSLGDIEGAGVGEVTLDLFCHTDTVQALFVDAVYDAPYRGSVLGLYTPLGLTDRSLLVYAMESCDGQPTLPADWDPAPGDTAADVRDFVSEVERIAATELCPHV